MIRSRPFLSGALLVALSLAPAAHGQSGERSDVPDQNPWAASIFTGEPSFRKWFPAWRYEAAMGMTFPGGLRQEETPSMPRRSEAQPRQVRAYVLWQQGNVLHVQGRFQAAADKFRESIEVLPTAEGHTFLGWSLSMLGQTEEAIAECEKAVALDPDYGNPYNDIGVYLIELGRPDEAIPWFEKAMSAKRYCCYQFPHFNLGRVLFMQGDLDGARRSFEQSLRHDPDYAPARMALDYLDAEYGKPL